MENKYNHFKVEKGKYKEWLEAGHFKSGKDDKKPFCIVLPPPNITGKLHIGHAMDGTIQDAVIRFKKMQGFDTLYLPGMDHAGISTQAKIDKKLMSEGLDPRKMDRDEWMVHAWSWKDEYAKSIREQWATLGLSLDYSKERFTLDEGSSDAVLESFVKLYEKGLIYRGERIINWDPVAMTALSNEEVIHKDIQGCFYHIKYFLEDNSDYLEIATTRPETLFGDTAIAVNPNDDKNKKFIGKKVILPIANKLIDVIADDYADMDKGSGAVKITPAHDPNDFLVGERHNLKRVVCIAEDGKMNENAFHYDGLDRFECRKKLVEELKEKDLLIQEEKIVHSVGHSERSNAIVEPYLSKQWFVKMDGLAKAVLELQSSDDKVKVYPKRLEKVLNNWLEGVHDWCISRQLWWGHQIPVWYKGDEIYVSKTPPETEGWTRDPDVLDTWFSSALWPFSTLGWPNEIDERYFPGDLLVTGVDIIFFWVARMLFQSVEFTGEKPFDAVLLHGLVRDKEGRKMSKSLGNGIDPLDMVEKYGTDSLRYYLATGAAPGYDLNFDEEKVKSTWNFINKFWNASRYVFINIEEDNFEIDLNNLSEYDKWILNKMNDTIKVVTKHMDKYEFNICGNAIYSFVWDDFCDWYIELSKLDMNNNTKAVLSLVLKNILKMLHPFMPYVTEEIYSNFNEGSIMVSEYPKYDKKLIFKSTNIDELIALITKVRKIRQEEKINKSFGIINDNSLVEENKKVIVKMTKSDILDESDYDAFIDIALKDNVVKFVYDSNVNNPIDMETLKKEKERLEKSIERRNKLLSNENYVANAPEAVVKAEKESLELEIKQLEAIISKL